MLILPPACVIDRKEGGGDFVKNFILCKVSKVNGTPESEVGMYLSKDSQKPLSMIDLSVKIPIDKSFPVDGMIPVKFDVPINLKLSTTTFGDALGQLQAALQQQADALTTPVKP